MKKKILITLAVFVLIAPAVWGGWKQAYVRLTAPAIDDAVLVVDVSDTTMATTGTQKYLELQDLPVSTPVQAVIDAHTGRTDNPHGVTASQVGAEPSDSDDINPDRLAGDTRNDGKIDVEILDITSADIQYDASTASGHPLNSDDAYSGMPLVGINAGESISQWQLVYFDTTATEWMVADADVSGRGPAWGIAVASGTDGAALSVLQSGFVRNDAWSFTPGELVYLDDDTAGAVVGESLKPATATDMLQPVGRAYTANIVWFDINPVTGFARIGS